ncbi:hypothetical protein ARMGADRAFT_1068529 [Armillaria gallica]|uniref:Uncharacterized protein n=1 Tax=Armillaria gallica TaxID=47427 RepID=A0A2H3CEI4_ARMGA|nr:hypothetical protein ARMGADRAFT_1068529 [Armillaria gallica]
MKFWLRNKTARTRGFQVQAHVFYPLHAHVNSRGADWRIQPSSFWSVDADLPVYSMLCGRGC